MTIADVYDALTSARCYKPSFGHDETLKAMQGDTGRHFDPELMDVMRECAEDFRRTGDAFR
jgi:putative two-component system response regulator